MSKTELLDAAIDLAVKLTSEDKLSRMVIEHEEGFKVVLTDSVYKSGKANTDFPDAFAKITATDVVRYRFVKESVG